MSWASTEMSTLSSLVTNLIPPEDLTLRRNQTDDNETVHSNSKNGTALYHGTEAVIPLAIIIIIIMVLTIIGNTMVILTIMRHRGMRTRTNMFITNLAVSDILAAVFDMPVSLVTLIKGDWIFGEEFCQFNGFTMAVFLITSIHTLMYISVHKYISITRPFSRFMTHRRIMIMIVCTWVWSIGYGVGGWLGWNKSVYKLGATQCGPSYPDNKLKISHSLANTIVTFLIPLIVMSFCYFHIFREIRNHMARMRQTSNMDMRNTLAQQKRIATTLFMVMACFLICLTPYICYSCSIVLMKEKKRMPPVVNPISYWCIYANSACNPIIYAFRSPSFRNGYKEIFMCGESVQYLSGDTQTNGSPRYHNRIFRMGSTSRRSSAESWRNISFLASWRRHKEPSVEATSVQRKNSDDIVPSKEQQQRSNGTNGKTMITITEDSCEDTDTAPPKDLETNYETEIMLKDRQEQKQLDLPIIEEPETEEDICDKEPQIEDEMSNTENTADNKSNDNTSDEGMLYDSDVEIENSVRRHRKKKPRKRLESRSCIIQCTKGVKKGQKGQNLKVLTQGGLSRSWSDFYQSDSTPSKPKKRPPPFLWQPSVDYLDIPVRLSHRSGHSEGNLADKDDTHLRPISKRLTNSFKMLFRKSREKVLEENYPPKACPENDS